jgi:hypothetical protein
MTFPIMIARSRMRRASAILNPSMMVVRRMSQARRIAARMMTMP